MTMYELLLDFASMMMVFRTKKSTSISNFEENTSTSSAWTSQGNHSSAVTFTVVMISGIVGSQIHNVSLSKLRKYFR